MLTQNGLSYENKISSFCTEADWGVMFAPVFPEECLACAQPPMSVGKKRKIKGQMSFSLILEMKQDGKRHKLE